MFVCLLFATRKMSTFDACLSQQRAVTKTRVWNSCPFSTTRLIHGVIPPVQTKSRRVRHIHDTRETTWPHGCCCSRKLRVLFCFWPRWFALDLLTAEDMFCRHQWRRRSAFKFDSTLVSTWKWTSLWPDLCHSRRQFELDPALDCCVSASQTLDPKPYWRIAARGADSDDEKSVGYDWLLSQTLYGQRCEEMLPRHRLRRRACIDTFQPAGQTPAMRWRWLRVDTDTDTTLGRHGSCSGHGEQTDLPWGGQWLSEVGERGYGGITSKSRPAPAAEQVPKRWRNKLHYITLHTWHTHIHDTHSHTHPYTYDIQGRVLRPLNG